MKLAYLILAHGNFLHLQRLLNALAAPNTDIYLHIDAKAQIPSELGLPEQVQLIPRRAVTWGGFSLLEAIMALCRQALSSDADYLLLLSGSDYPIMSREKLEQILSEQKEFINTKAVPFTSKPLSRFNRYHFKDLERQKPKLKDRALSLIERVLKRIPLKRKIPELTLHAGSTWFALSKACVAEVVRYTDKNPKVYQFFKNSLCPDEAYLQTIIAQSSFASRCRPNLSFVKWEEGRANPKAINLNDLEALKKRQTFISRYGTHQVSFARKFSDQDGLLCEWIDQNLRS